MANQSGTLISSVPLMGLEINVIDAFKDTVFKGNLAAVIITDSWLGEDLIQSLLD